MLKRVVNWFYALVAFIIGSTLILSVSDRLISIDMYYPNLNYIVLFVLILCLGIVTWRKASGE